MAMSVVAVSIELGHTARVLQHVTKEGFTHEWSVWVRGENDRSLADIVEKVVFNLHESFKGPKRTLQTPPFIITEKGFEYNLVLQDLQAPPITLTRCERLTFYSPQEELKKKLLAAGGTCLASGKEEFIGGWALGELP
ncbi:protein AF-9-like [Hyalella azteca]|uniref:Protein AF-9-like n=1 Tax=Hyalella azteca TaxID=294128 RepID=A0A8B7NB64_HYAAZ|nr:protein AF-9-like [Hyalella azteca]